MKLLKRSAFLQFSSSQFVVRSAPNAASARSTPAPASTEGSTHTALEFLPMSAPVPAIQRTEGERVKSLHKMHVHQPGRKKKPAANRSWKPLLVFLLSGGLALAFVSWGAFVRLSKSSASDGINLRSDSSFSKLKTTSAEAPPVQEPSAPVAEPEIPSLEEEDAIPPPPPEHAVLPPVEDKKGPEPPEQLDPAVPVVPPPLPPPVLPESKPAEPPALNESAATLIQPAEDPLAVPPFLASHRGESPMLRTWKLVGWSTLLTAALATPAVAQKTDTEKILERLDKMEESWKQTVKDIGTDIRTLQGNVLMHNLELGKLRKEMDTLKQRIPPEFPSGIDKTSVDELKDRIGRLEQALNKLPTQSRVALSPPQAGRLMLVNQYQEELLFRVNQQDYRVAPGMTTRVEGVPAGEFTYEVISPSWGLRANKRTNLSANETFTITAR
jgi:hypothetical protein